MERISAFVDGELEDHELAGELAKIKGDPEREATWAVYHLIGDALRGESVAVDQLTSRVHDRLGLEPTIIAPRRWKRRTTRQVALPLAASLCGAAVVAWLALSNNAVVSPVSEPLSVATAPETKKGAYPTEADAMSEYLMAHQQFSPSTAMQGVVPYVRTVAAADSSR